MTAVACVLHLHARPRHFTLWQHVCLVAPLCKQTEMQPPLSGDGLPDRPPGHASDLLATENT